MEHPKKNPQQNITRPAPAGGQGDFGLAYITSKNQKEAQKLAHICLSQKLTACVNIIPSVVSCYQWKGEFKQEPETIVLMKTRADLFHKLCAVIKQNHSYECPCVVFIPFSKADAVFLQWINSELTK